MNNVAPQSELDIVDSGRVTAPALAGTNVLNDNTKIWAANIHKNRLVRIISGPGTGQTALIESNSASALVIKGTWTTPLSPSSQYVILGVSLAQILRDVFGGGSNISVANPLQVHDPKVGSIETATAYTESSASGTTADAYADALDLDTRGMKSFSAVVKNTDGANSLDYRVRVRPANYAAGADEEIPEAPGEETLATGQKGLVTLIKAYSRVKIQVKSTLALTPADYTIDYVINR